MDDYNLLQTRIYSNVILAEARGFHGTAHLFSNNAAATGWNWERLKVLRTPIAKIRASSFLSGSRNHTADRYRGLAPELYLTKGAIIFVDNKV